MWDIEVSDEVAEWYLSLGTRGRAFADRAFDRLKVRGPELAMPHSRGLGDGLRELRFTCEGSARRITYYFDLDRKAILLTSFRKQRDNERREVERAQRARVRDAQRKEEK